MPNWKIHLEIAKRLNVKFRFNDRALEQFIIGNILPDVNNGHMIKDVSKIFSHKMTHYSKLNSKTYENFANIYKNIMFNEPLILGYYTHLYTDYLWNNDFYKKINRNIKYNTLSHDELKKIKHNDFRCFNNKYLNNRIRIFQIDEIVNKSKYLTNIYVQKSDIEKVISYINSEEKLNIFYKFYKEEELERLLDESVKIILKDVFQNINND